VRVADQSTSLILQVVTMVRVAKSWLNDQEGDDHRSEDGVRLLEELVRD
jgi:hypothetical protein